MRRLRQRCREPRGYYWRHVRCDGCEKACRYRDARLGLPSFAEVYATLRAAHERGDFRHPYKRRGTILGILHQMKLSFWNDHVEWCRRAVESGDGSDDSDDGDPERATGWEWFSPTAVSITENCSQAACLAKAR